MHIPDIDKFLLFLSLIIKLPHAISMDNSKLTVDMGDGSFMEVTVKHVKPNNA